MTPEAVRNGCRFVMDIGDGIEPVLKEYGKYQSAKVEACARVGDVELVMKNAEIRFMVAQKRVTVAWHSTTLCRTFRSCRSWTGKSFNHLHDPAVRVVVEAEATERPMAATPTSLPSLSGAPTAKSPPAVR